MIRLVPPPGRLGGWGRGDRRWMGEGVVGRHNVTLMLMSHLGFGPTEFKLILAN